MAQQTYTPSGRGPEVIGVFAFFIGLTTLTFALRVYVRTSLVKKFGPEDWTAALGWLLFIIHSAFAIAGVYHGSGQHMNLIQPPTEMPIALMVRNIVPFPLWLLEILILDSGGGFANLLMSSRIWLSN